MPTTKISDRARRIADTMNEPFARRQKKIVFFDHEGEYLHAHDVATVRCISKCPDEDGSVTADVWNSRPEHWTYAEVQRALDYRASQAPASKAAVTRTAKLAQAIAEVKAEFEADGRYSGDDEGPATVAQIVTMQEIAEEAQRRVDGS